VIGLRRLPESCLLALVQGVLERRALAHGVRDVAFSSRETIRAGKDLTAAQERTDLVLQRRTRERWSVTVEHEHHFSPLGIGKRYC
jgi:hypothetical protein